MDDVMFHAEYDCSHDDCCKHCLVEVQFKGMGGSGGVHVCLETLGMKAQYSMRQARQIMTRAPVNKPPAWVFTPLAQLTAVLQFFVFLFRSDLNQDHLENDPVVGMEEKNEPMMLQAPSAIISWLASKGFPPATRKGVL